MSDDVYLPALKFVSVYGAIPAALFVFLYLRTKWEDTKAGRHLMFFTAALAVAFVALAVRLFDVRYAGERIVFLGAMFLVASLLWQRLWLLIRVQYRDGE